jgi:hypothetical protein
MFKRFSPYHLETVTVHAATGADAMRNGKTYFERVPMEVVKAVVRQAAALAAMVEKSPAPVSKLERQPAEECPKQLRQNGPSKGQL